MESHRAFGRAGIFSASGIRSFTANGMDLMSWTCSDWTRASVHIAWMRFIRS